MGDRYRGSSRSLELCFRLESPTDRQTDRREEDSYRPLPFLLRQRRCIKRESVVILCPKRTNERPQSNSSLRLFRSTLPHMNVFVARSGVGAMLQCSTVNERVCWVVVRVCRMKSNEATKCPTDADVFTPFVVLSFD